MRHFDFVREDVRKFPNNDDLKLPKRSDPQSAGYDFYSNEDFTIQPNCYHTFWTDIKAFMQPNEVLQIYTRSGNGTKRGIVLRNGVGIVDASYYGNPSNDGNIGICLLNTGTEPFVVQCGDRIAQGIFYNYLINETDSFGIDVQSPVRLGGFGSSGK